MTPMDCQYNLRIICDKSDTPYEKRNCTECDVYKHEMSLIQCPCGFISEQSKWYNVDNNIGLISCPECGTVKLLTEKIRKWRKKDRNILF